MKKYFEDLLSDSSFIDQVLQLNNGYKIIIIENEEDIDYNILVYKMPIHFESHYSEDYNIFSIIKHNNNFLFYNNIKNTSIRRERKRIYEKYIKIFISFIEKINQILCNKPTTTSSDYILSDYINY